jgi:hypothetical protein
MQDEGGTVANATDGNRLKRYPVSPEKRRAVQTSFTGGRAMKEKCGGFAENCRRKSVRKYQIVGSS